MKVSEESGRVAKVKMEIEKIYALSAVDGDGLCLDVQDGEGNYLGTILTLLPDGTLRLNEDKELVELGIQLDGDDRIVVLPASGTVDED